MSLITVTEDMINEIQKQDQVIIMFFAPWSGYCKRLSPVVKQLAKTYDIYSVNIDELEDFRNTYGIETIPTFLVLKKGISGRLLIDPNAKSVILDWLKQELIE